MGKTRTGVGGGRGVSRGFGEKGFWLPALWPLTFQSRTSRRSADLGALAKFHILKFLSATRVRALWSCEGLLKGPP